MNRYLVTGAYRSDGIERELHIDAENEGQVRAEMKRIDFMVAGVIFLGVSPAPQPPAQPEYQDGGRLSGEYQAAGIPMPRNRRARAKMQRRMDASRNGPRRLRARFILSAMIFTVLVFVFPITEFRNQHSYNDVTYGISFLIAPQWFNTMTSSQRDLMMFSNQIPRWEWDEYGTDERLWERISRELADARDLAKSNGTFSPRYGWSDQTVARPSLCTSAAALPFIWFALGIVYFAIRSF